MQIRRIQAQPAVVSMVSMVDVLMTLLIFFMVTSTYLELGMIPMADAKDDPAPQLAEPAPAGASLLIRLGPDGSPRVRGRLKDANALTDLLRAQLARHPDATVVVLPSGHADAQALVSLLDVATRAGVRNLHLLRLEAVP